VAISIKLLVIGLLIGMAVANGSAVARLPGYEKLVNEEAKKLQMTNGAVTRVGDVLTLRAGNGTTVMWQDKDDCGVEYDIEHCVKYIFVGHLPDHHGFLVVVLPYEGSSCEWIDDLTGEITALEDKPHFAPSGDRFAVVRATEAYGFNGIQVWSRQAGKLALEWEHVPKGKEYALYEFSGWDGDDTVLLSRNTLVDGAWTEGLPARVVKAGEWSLQAPTAASR
jgi:hypothetical protein